MSFRNASSTTLTCDRYQKHLGRPRLSLLVQQRTGPDFTAHYEVQLSFISVNKGHPLRLAAALR